MTRPRIGLVYGAGGASGGAFIRAAAAALDERAGWKPNMSDIVIGTSVGALNAARIHDTPLDPTPPVAEALADLAERLRPPSFDIAARLAAPPRTFAGRALGRLLPKGKHAPDYEVAPPPYHSGVRVVSCRRSDGVRRITILAEATEPAAELYASAAIPGIAPPVVIGQEEYVDGAVWSTTNADLVGPEELDLLVVIAPMAGETSLLARSHRALVARELEPWRLAAKPVVFVAPRVPRSDAERLADDARRQILST